MPDSKYVIRKVDGREILDSRGNPTLQVDVHTVTGFGRFSVPSGASKGRFEAVELRDGNRRRFQGLGVSRALRNVVRIIGPAIIGMDSRNQDEIDSKLLKLDGTKNKSRLGANAILGVSMATARAKAETEGVSFYRSIQGRRSPLLPVPLMNILNGGKHAGNDLSFQEFMIIPVRFRRFGEALRSGAEIYHVLGQTLAEKYGRAAANVGDEGGFAPSMKSVRDALDAVNEAVETAGYSPGREVALGIDAAADSFYDARRKSYKVDGQPLSRENLFDFYLELCRTFPVRSVEDPFQDEDFTGFAKLTKRLGSKVQVVGDDLFVTSAARVDRGISLGAANALLVKVNQAGTLTETIQAMERARGNGYGLIMSHRSGETEDTSIADLSVGLATGQIKAGAPARGERTAKYNRLLEIEEELGSKAGFYGPRFFSQS